MSDSTTSLKVRLRVPYTLRGGRAVETRSNQFEEIKTLKRVRGRVLYDELDSSKDKRLRGAEAENMTDLRSTVLLCPVGSSAFSFFVVSPP